MGWVPDFAFACSCRQAAETLLILTSTDPASSSAPPAKRAPLLAELTAANVAERGPKASPLQALVQDIMREQQQRQASTALVRLYMLWL